MGKIVLTDDLRSRIELIAQRLIGGLLEDYPLGHVSHEQHRVIQRDITEEFTEDLLAEIQQVDIAELPEGTPEKHLHSFGIDSLYVVTLHPV
jgi:hypothetical protein